jgi:hypothetical protein
VKGYLKFFTTRTISHEKKNPSTSVRKPKRLSLEAKLGS